MIPTRIINYIKTGELDTADVPADLSEQLLKMERSMSKTRPERTSIVSILDKEPFQNKNIRKAFAMAVDQKQMVDFVTKNKEKPAYGFVSNGFKDADRKGFPQNKR